MTAPGGAATPRVALIGRAGSGKTALLRALFGAQSEPSANGSGVRYQDAVAPLIVDDLPGWVNGDEGSVNALFAWLESTRAAGAPLDAIWYTLDASSARVTDYELQLIRRLAQQSPLVVVLTRTDLISAEARTAMQSAIADAAIPNCLGAVAVAADPLPALGIAPYGVAEVVALTTEPARQPRGQRATRPLVATERPEQAARQPEPRPAPDTGRREQAPVSGVGGATRAEYGRSGAATSAAYATADVAESGAGPSGALIVALVLLALAVALLLLRRRSRDAASTDE